MVEPTKTTGANLEKPLLSLAVHPGAVSRLASSSLLLLCAVALGGALALLATQPLKWVAVFCVGICGVCGVLFWRSAGWPVRPLLQVALIASFSFRLEINLFSVFKYHESPPGVNISLMMIIALLLLGMHLSDRFRGKPREAVIPPSFSLLSILMVCWCTLATIDSSEPLLGFFAVELLAVSVLMCFVTVNEFGSREALRLAAVTIVVTTGVSGVIGFLQQQAGLFNDWTLLGAVREENRQLIGDGEVERASGFMTNPNGFAWHLVTFLPTALSLLVFELKDFRGWKRWMVGASAGLGVIALILTYARGSWIAFGASLPALAALSYRAMARAERRRLTSRIAFCVVLTMLLCLPFAGAIYTRLTEDDRGSAQTRVPLMQVAAAMIADNPWLGVGPSAYEAEMRRYDQTADRITDTFDWPVHNMFLHLTAETGVPTLLCFAALAAIAMKRGWQTLGARDPFLRAMAIGLMVGMLAYLITGLKELSSCGSLRTWYLVCGLLLALDRARRREEEGIAT